MNQQGGRDSKRCTVSLLAYSQAGLIAIYPLNAWFGKTKKFRPQCTTGFSMPSGSSPEISSSWAFRAAPRMASVQPVRT